MELYVWFPDYEELPTAVDRGSVIETFREFFDEESWKHAAESAAQIFFEEGGYVFDEQHWPLAVRLLCTENGGDIRNYFVNAAVRNPEFHATYIPRPEPENNPATGNEP